MVNIDQQRSRSHLSLPLPPPPPPMLGGASVPPPPPSGLPLPPVLGQLSPSTPMPVTSPADVIKKQFLDCGETNDFHRLTRAGDTKNIKNMASNDPELINSRDHLGRTSLWICSSVSMSWTAQTLDCLCNLDGIKIDKPDVRDQTPLFAAVKYNLLENVRTLLRYGANPNGIGLNGESPVHVAVRDGFSQVLELLLVNGANPDGLNQSIHVSNFGTIPLYTSVIYDRFDEFLLLLKYGADPNLIMKQPGFSNSLIDGSIRHNAEVKWIKALFIAGMSPYQSVTQTKNTARARELLEEVQKQKSTPRRLKERARHVIRKHLRFGKSFEIMPLPLPVKLRNYLKYPELFYL